MAYAGKKDREEIGAKPLPVRRLLGQDRLHAIPLFQRPYVWTLDRQWQPFWDDVRSVADSILAKRPKAHFLGAVVFKMEVFVTGGMEVREVIDGQQRLFTLLILIKALRDLCLERGMGDDVRDLGSLLFNDPGRCVNEDDRFKLLPNNVDREPFLRVMNVEGPAELQTGTEEEIQRKPLVDAYLFFSGQAGPVVGVHVIRFKAATTAPPAAPRTRPGTAPWNPGVDDHDLPQHLAQPLLEP